MSDLRLSAVPEEDCAAFIAMFEGRKTPRTRQGFADKAEQAEQFHKAQRHAAIQSNARTQFARDIAKANP